MLITDLHLQVNQIEFRMKMDYKIIRNPYIFYDRIT